MTENLDKLLFAITHCKTYFIYRHYQYHCIILLFYGFPVYFCWQSFFRVYLFQNVIHSWITMSGNLSVVAFEGELNAIVREVSRLNIYIYVWMYLTQSQETKYGNMAWTFHFWLMSGSENANQDLRNFNMTCCFNNPLQLWDLVSNYFHFSALCS